jgi:hypothetical protein
MTKTEAKPQPFPADLAAVALIDAPVCAAAGAMSVSWWLEQVRIGKAPEPAVRMPRCTRWLAAEVAQFWTDFAAKGRADYEGTYQVLKKAKKASAAAQAKRAAMARGAEA